MKVFVIFSVICVVFFSEIVTEKTENEEAIEVSEEDENVVVLFGLDNFRGIRDVAYDFKGE